MFTLNELAQRQSLPLEAKVRMTKQRIEQWYNHWDGQVYVSFSGGKDSTVLLHIARSLYPDIEAVFVDTGLEYPEIREFVKTIENVTWLKPKMNFKSVVIEKGYPIISKEQSQYIREYRDTESDKLKDIRWNGNKWGMGKISEKWKPMVESPYKISNKCCDIMKKNPAKSFERETGKKPIVGSMACESRNRTTAWQRNGCNAFESKRPLSQPMSFWTENDVLEYLLVNKVDYCPVYGDIVPTGKVIEIGFSQVEEFKTTQAQRTGCVFCMYGLALESEPNRFQKLKTTHPNLYDYCMKPITFGGLGLAEVIDYMNDNCKCNINY